MYYQQLGVRRIKQLKGLMQEPAIYFFLKCMFLQFFVKNICVYILVDSQDVCLLGTNVYYHTNGDV